MKNYLLVLIVIHSLLLSGCKEFLYYRDINKQLDATLATLAVPPEIEHIKTIRGNSVSSDGACEYAEADIIFGSNLEPQHAFNQFIEMLINDGWIEIQSEDLVVAESDWSRIFYRGENEKLVISTVLGFYPKTQVDIEELYTRYQTLIEVIITYSLPRRSNC